MATKYHNEKVRLEAFMVHFDAVDNLVSFEVYPVQDWKKDGQSGFSYISKDGPAEYMDFEEGKCLMKMKGTYVWRGQWESRVYFTDSSYWGSELSDLSQLFVDHIQPWCEQYLSLNKPDRK